MQVDEQQKEQVALQKLLKLVECGSDGAGKHAPASALVSDNCKQAMWALDSLGAVLKTLTTCCRRRRCQLVDH